MTIDDRRLNNLLALIRSDRAHRQRGGRAWSAASGVGRPVFIQHCDERFADAEFGQQLLRVVEGRLRIILGDADESPCDHWR